jgi:hypothetical protein
VAALVEFAEHGRDRGIHVSLAVLARTANIVNGMGAFGCREVRNVRPECIAMEHTTSALAHCCPTLGE